MNQSSFIAGALLAGFVLWLAAQNKLSNYTAVLWGNTTAAVPSVGGASGGSAGTASSITGGDAGGDIGSQFADALPQLAFHAAVTAFTGGLVP